jgi:hypothetical protein
MEDSGNQGEQPEQSFFHFDRSHGDHQKMTRFQVVQQVGSYSAALVTADPLKDHPR